MRNKIFTLISALTIAGSLMAAVGPQSVRVTFNGDNAEGWVASSSGSITSVADGVANVQMALQSNSKYRADFQYNTSGTFTFDKSKDVVWAIKLTGALPGTANSRKFEIQYNDGGDKWINGISGPSGALDCTDGGKIYYFNLGADGLNKLSGLPEGTINVKQIHFIMADATDLTDETAKYAVDWVASYASVNDLKSFADWTDEAQEADASLPYHELCFRPRADGSGYDKRGNGFGTRDDDQQFEGNYQARFFAVEYFLIEDFSAEKIYTLALTTTGSGGTDALSVWDFPYQVNYETSASDMITKATAVVGYAPGSTGSMNTPIATSLCNANVWSFSIPADKLTALATIGTKTLVGVLVTSNVHDADKKGKFASASHTTVNHPSLTYAGTAAIVNTTQGKQEATLAEAVSNAAAGDVITIYEDITGPTSRMDIAKALTIQGATGTEKITCAVAAKSIMILANGSEGHTLTFKNLVIDGNNVSRSKQTFEAAGDANICLDGVQFVNTAYSEVTGDVKNTGNKNIILKGTNSIPNGIYLNRNKRIKHDGATHTDPIKIVLADDYVAETYSIVLTCSDPTLYTAELANGTAWQLFKKESQNELAGRTMPAHTYDLTVGDAKMATLVLGFDAAIPAGIKAYKLTNDGTSDIYAEEQGAIAANEPVLIVAAAADTYTFSSETGVRLNEQANPESGCLRGTYETSVAVANNSAGVYNYILANVGGNVGFYQANTDGTTTIARNRAYLFSEYAGGGTGAPMRIRFGGQTATSNEQVPSDQAQGTKVRKMMLDGELLLERDGHLYRMDGQMLQ